MPGEPGAYRLFLYAYDEAGNAATANLPVLVKGEVRTQLPLFVYHDGFEGMPWAPSGWMGSTESLTLDGAHVENCHAGKACIKLRYTGEFNWVGVAWQHPANNWGSQNGGYDLAGARYLELWARGEFGGERVSFGVGLLGEDTAHPDSGKAIVEGIILQQQWRRYRVPLRWLSSRAVDHRLAGKYIQSDWLAGTTRSRCLEKGRRMLRQPAWNAIDRVRESRQAASRRATHVAILSQRGSLRLIAPQRE